MGEASRLRASGGVAEAEAIEDTALAMRRTVDRELARARSAAARTDAAHADLAQVAEQVIAVLRRTPDGARLGWQQSIPPGFAVALDPSDLAEALGALAENATRYARSRVALTAQKQDPHLYLSVTDDGPGIPPEKRAALIGRHARADVSGTGLGLSIASEIAQAAGGALTLADTDAGFAATLVLPMARRHKDGFHRS
ncbi:MAG: ATP-binding protein [Marivita sp.]|uniref:ATP-binding protein n=1 Tax=Marivita sp. TaxID=2003365 RepID=UPI003EF6C9D3